MEWNVYIGDFNRGTIETYNVFRHYYFVRDLAETLLKIEKMDTLSEGKRKEVFTEEAKRWVMYYFWAKCEWEVIISHWPPCDNDRFKDKKVDVYDQITQNWDRFIDYIWANRKELKTLIKEYEARK